MFIVTENVKIKLNGQNYLLEQGDKINILSEAYAEPIQKNTDFAVMANIDNKYFDDGYAQNEDDLRDDMMQPGFIGYNLYTDNKKLVGYLYGYSITYDELDDLDELDDIHIHKDIDVTYQNNIIKLSDLFNLIEEDNFAPFLDVFNETNSLYVANFTIEETMRRYIFKLLNAFVKHAKNSGIKYLLCDAHPDTQNLIHRKWSDKVIASIDDQLFLIEI